MAASATVGVHHHQFHHATKLRTLNCIASSSAQQEEELLRSGKVRAIPAKDAAQALRAEGYKLLDVRPAWEWEKARVVGSVHVPFFVEDKGMDPVTLLKKWVHFGYIGLWTGQLLTTINDQFLSQIKDAIDDDDDKEVKLLVACGEGLRSRVALKELEKGGYKNLAWLAGGFNRSKNSDFPDVQGSGKLQFATIGGVSYIFLQLLLILKVLD